MSDGEREKQDRFGELDLPGFELAIISKIHDLGFQRTTSSSMTLLRARDVEASAMAEFRTTVAATPWGL